MGRDLLITSAHGQRSRSWGPGAGIACHFCSVDGRVEETLGQMQARPLVIEAKWELIGFYQYDTLSIVLLIPYCREGSLHRFLVSTYRPNNVNYTIMVVISA